MENKSSVSRVKAVRDAHELTQKEFAKRLGCSYGSERRFEYSDTLPKVEAVLKNLQRLAKAKGIELEKLAEEKAKKKQAGGSLE